MTTYIVECHTGLVEDFEKPSHTFSYTSATFAMDKVKSIFQRSIDLGEHQSPIVRVRCVSDPSFE